MNTTMPKNPNLVEVTTPAQAKNGTRVFHDTDSDCYYGSYASGYVRRFYTLRYKKSSRTVPPNGRESVKRMYPLNRRIKNDWRSAWPPCAATTCIMIMHEADRIAMIDKAADRGWTA